MAFTLKNLIGLVQVAIQNHASDIHLRMGESPCLRIRGDLVPVQTRPFAKEDIEDICKIIFQNDQTFSQLHNIKELDGGFTIPDTCRLRFNFFHFNEKMGIILRIVRNSIPTIEQLQLPPIIGEIALHQYGLILVTGPTGSGKSTTLAAMINHINHLNHAHIITIEDPIEYIHPQIKSRLTQREVGRDTESFQAGLRAALRQDPDIILIGEMRDPETVGIALKAAETGHLVLSTVHTTNAITTIGRIISMFPPEEQPDVCKRLSENLYATIGQRMLKGAQGKHIVLALEIMLTTPGVKECIRGEEPLGRILEIIQEGRGPSGNGSQSFEQHIMELFKKGIITKDTALESVEGASDFQQQLLIEK
ncbi:MAG: PilT/PilU family type 4a pilus ATPase [Bdellovibrio sp.]|nr:PilT/PilU family type 4a pilus ATPase [Bdellovibrio sp.]